ncbi:MAG: hypothetical protein QOG43_1664 [Actinomycetota bacterium]|nr:hypothetical protein [Actinomycetota bacterium]
MHDLEAETGEDWYTAAVDRVESSAMDLRAVVEGTVDLLRQARRERLGGRGLVDIVEGLVEAGGREARLAPTVAFRDFERAVTAYRAAVVRGLVDQEHMTFSTVAQLTGVSRQMIARLYRGATG